MLRSWRRWDDNSLSTILVSWRGVVVWILIIMRPSMQIEIWISTIFQLINVSIKSNVSVINYWSKSHCGKLDSTPPRGYFWPIIILSTHSFAPSFTLRVEVEKCPLRLIATLNADDPTLLQSATNVQSWHSISPAFCSLSTQVWQKSFPRFVPTLETMS